MQRGEIRDPSNRGTTQCDRVSCNCHPTANVGVMQTPSLTTERDAGRLFLSLKLSESLANNTKGKLIRNSIDVKWPGKYGYSLLGMRLPFPNETEGGQVSTTQVPSPESALGPCGLETPFPDLEAPDSPT